MNTYTQLFYQIVFSTKRRRATLTNQNRTQLHRYIWGILKNKKCYLHQINSVDDHIHILVNTPPYINISSLVKDIKVASNKMIKEQGVFPNFCGWQNGFGAFTYSYKDRGRLIKYVKNQQAHHKKKSFREEYIELLREYEIEFNEDYLL